MIGLMRIVLALDSHPSNTFGCPFGEVLGRMPEFAAGVSRSALKLRSTVVDTPPAPVRAVAFSTSSPTTKDAAARPIPPTQ
jgi:hypothetical protein